MKKLFLSALLVALVLPAIPGGAGASGADGVMVAQSSTSNDTSNDTGSVTRGTGNRNNLTYAGQAEATGVEVVVSGEPLGTAEIKVDAANARTSECAGTACADAAGAAPPVGAQAQAREPSDREDTVLSFNLDGEDEDLEEFITATFGRALARTASGPAARGNVDGALINLVLTPNAVNELPDGLVASLTATLRSLDEALAGLPDGDELDGLDDAVSDLRADIGSRPLVRIRGGDAESATSFDDGVIRAESTVDTSTITIIPTDADTEEIPDGLLVIEIGHARTAAAANGSARPTIFSSASDVSVTILPGLLDVLPRDASGNAPGVADVVGQLPTALQDMLPPPLRTPAAAAGGAVLDLEAAGLRIDLGTESPQTCFLDGTGLETCVDPQGTDQSFDPSDLGVGVLTRPVLVRMLPEDTSVDATTYQAAFSVNRTAAGAAGAFVSTATGASTSNSNPTTSSQSSLPRTGASGTFVLPALGMMLLSGLILFGLRRREQ